MANCPACGKEQSGAAAFCASCGALLDRPDTSAIPPPASPVIPTVTQAAQARPPRTNVAHASSLVATDDFGDIGQYIARRLFALIVDLIGVSVLLATGIGFLVAQRGADPHSYAGFFETAIYTLFALIIYRCLSEAYLATTLGKALVGLQVRAPGSERIGIGRALGRNALLAFDLCIIGFVLAAITPRRKRIGDFVAGTEVVNARRAALGTVVALAVLAAWGYAEYAFGDGLRTAQTLSNTAETYAPTLLRAQGTPPPAPSPLPERTPVPTEQPLIVPTLAPTLAPTPSESPSANVSAPPSPQASPSSASPAPSPTTS